MVDKIPVVGKPILCLSGLSPFRHDVQRAVPLLEEDDVRYHLGTGILFERVIRQTDSSQQLDVYKRQVMFVAFLLVLLASDPAVQIVPSYHFLSH